MISLNGSNAFYLQSDYQQVSRKELASPTPIPKPIYKYESESRSSRTLKKNYIYYCLPYWDL